MKKSALFLSVLFSSAIALTAAPVSANVNQTTLSFKFQGKNYQPEKAKTHPLTQTKLLEKITTAREYDNDLAKKFKENPKLVPFTDLYEEYGKVFKSNDELLLEILNGNYNSNVLNSYQSYFDNMIKNFKQNKELFKERDGNKQIVMSLEDMFNKLMIQQDGHVKFFNQLKKINM